MRLHRLTLQNFRGVAHRELELPDSGVIVVEGANEIGKSSMIEAIDLLLEEKDSSSKAQVKSIKPVDADVGSSVEAEISTGPYRFTYRKQWNRLTETVLTVTAPKREQLTGVPAHERVRAMLAATMDDKLFKAMRIMQATPLDQANLGESGALVTALDLAAGAAADPTGGETLIAAVENEFRTYFTATGRPTGILRAAQERLPDARAAAREAAERLDEVARDAAALDRLIQQRAELKSRRAAAERRVLASTLDSERVGTLQRKLDQADRSADAAAAAAARAERDLQDRLELVAEVERREELVRRLQAGVDSATVALEAVVASVAAAKLAADERSAISRRARIHADGARAQVEHLQDVALLDQLSARIAEIDACRADIESARAVCASIAVDTAMLRNIETACHAVDLAVTRQLAAAGQLIIEPLGPGQLDVDHRHFELQPGHPTTRPVTDDITVVVADLVRFTVRPAAAARHLADEVAAARQALADCLRDGKAADLGQARELHERRRDAERSWARAEQRWAQLLGDESTEQVRERIDGCLRDIEAFRAAHADPSELPENAAQARVLSRDAERALVEADRELQEAQRRVSALSTQQHALTVDVTKVVAALIGQQEERGSADRKLGTARELGGDTDLRARSEATRQAAAQAEAVALQLRSDLLAADPGGVRTRLAEADSNAATVADAVAATASGITRLRARLEVTGSEGRQDACDAALTAVEAAYREHRRISERAEAAQLLFVTMREHRLLAKARYVAPFRVQVLRLGRILHGPDFDVEIDADLRIVSRTVAGVTVRFESLSTGAKEQLAIMTRLACAAVVAGEDGVPLIIDDALGYTDPERLRRMGAIFQGAGATSQLILLTCTPERYRAIGATRIIQLEPSGAALRTPAGAPAEPGAPAGPAEPAAAPKVPARAADAAAHRRHGARVLEPAAGEPGLFSVPGTTAPPAAERIRPPSRRRGSATHVAR